VIVGGVGMSTLLTMLVVPSLYLLIGGLSRPSNYVLRPPRPTSRPGSRRRTTTPVQPAE
jgi:hypothetical protein